MDRREFEQRFLQDMNEQQRSAITAPLCRTLTLAVPGSGKTTVLIRRVGYLVHVLGIPAEHILTITFTRAAANEMRQRYITLFGAENPNSLPFGTINAFCLNIVRRRYGDSLKTLGKNEEAQLRRILRESWQRYNGEEAYPDDNIMEQLRLDISYIKNMCITDPEEMNRHDGDMPHLSDIFEDYCSALRRMRRMDFDDQLVLARSILESDPELLQACRRQYPCICVDEAQDTSKIQHDIIRLLAAPKNQLFMVGDEDQSIYGFRAAYPQALTEFPVKYPDAELRKLELNYRSTPAIVSAAARFIAGDPARFPKEMRAVSESETPLRVIHVRDIECQGLFLTELLKQHKFRCAVLFRNNDSAIPLIDLFSRNGIPFTARLTGSRFFDNTVVADVTAIIRFAASPNDTEAFNRIYYRIGLRLNREGAARLCSRCMTTGKPLTELLLADSGLSDGMRSHLEKRVAALKKLAAGTAEEAMEIICDDLQYAAFVRQRRYDAGKLEILWAIATHAKTPMGLLQRLEELNRLIQSCGAEREPVVMLSTIHSAKGLEYDRVFLYDILNGICPRLTLQECETPEERAEYYEDRRLFYVAMTRARKELFCFSCCAGSEFTEQVIGALPAPTQNAVTKTFGKTVVGRKLTDDAGKKQEILGYCGNVYLVSSDGSLSLLTVDALISGADRQWRDRFQAAAAAMERIRDGSSIQAGTRLRFIHEQEEGTIQNRSGKYVDILFTQGEQAGQVRKYNLDFLLENNRILLLSDSGCDSDPTA